MAWAPYWLATSPISASSSAARSLADADAEAAFADVPALMAGVASA